MNTYAALNTKAPPFPSVERVTENKLTPSLELPSAHNVAKLTSAKQNPVATKYIHIATNTSELGRNPLGPVISGSANTPAPTVVPAINAAFPKTDPDSCAYPSFSFTFDHKRVVTSVFCNLEVLLFSIVVVDVSFLSSVSFFEEEEEEEKEEEEGEARSPILLVLLLKDDEN
jgi:hypothetical protein